METISELAAALFVFCLGFITLIEYFYHIIQDKIRKKHHSHTPLATHGVDKRKEGIKEGFYHGASCLLAFLLTIISLIPLVFMINII